MHSKTIKCPQCGVMLSVKNPRNEAVKQVNCPQCGVLLQLRFHSVGIPQASSNTLLPASGAHCLPVLMFNNQRYFLKSGRNIVGRKATTSEATIQIDTTDRMMSRQHAIIEVSKSEKGGLHTIICNYQNKNATLVNDEPLLADDQIRLMNRYVVTMGETKMIYVEEPLIEEKYENHTHSDG